GRESKARTHEGDLDGHHPGPQRVGYDLPPGRQGSADELYAVRDVAEPGRAELRGHTGPDEEREEGRQSQPTSERGPWGRGGGPLPARRCGRQMSPNSRAACRMIS